MLKSSIAKRLMLAGLGGLVFSVPAYAQSLDNVLSVATRSTAASAASQQTVEQLDDEADQAIREYRAVLQQKDNIALFVAQQDIFLQSQLSEIESLKNQLSTVESIKQGMTPMMLRMAAAIEDSVKTDMPFNEAERMARMANVQSVLGDPNVTPTEQYRRVLNAYKIETSYGLGVASYAGAHPTKPGHKVNFLRFGRVALVYMTKDESEIARYNLGTGQWDVLSGADSVNMRRAIRVAREQAAPEILFAPVAK